MDEPITLGKIVTVDEKFAQLQSMYEFVAGVADEWKERILDRDAPDLQCFTFDEVRKLRRRRILRIQEFELETQTRSRLVKDLKYAAGFPQVFSSESAGADVLRPARA